MAQEYVWNAEINGISYKVECVISNNRYILFVNDDNVATFYRKMFRNSVDKPLQIGGQQCRFVVWNELPDLVVDGKLLTRNCDYQPTKRQRGKVSFMCGIGMTVIAVLAILAYVILTLAGEDMSQWRFTVIAAVLLLISGIWDIRASRKDFEG